jgi:RNA polymerase sigma-70 factor (ECF subfamily)
MFREIRRELSGQRRRLDIDGVKVCANESGQLMSAARDQRFTDVYVAHYADVHGYLLRRSAVDDARDAASEVFTVVWRRIDEMPADVRALPWLYGVAARVLANQRRGNRRRRDLRTRLDRVASTSAVASVRAAAEAEPNDSLMAALNTLGHVDREILLLNAWEGLPASQIAVRFEISLDAAEKRLTRAKARLERALAQTEHSMWARPTSGLAEGRTT